MPTTKIGLVNTFLKRLVKKNIYERNGKTQKKYKTLLLVNNYKKY